MVGVGMADFSVGSDGEAKFAAGPGSLEVRGRWLCQMIWVVVVVLVLSQVPEQVPVLC